MGRLSLGNGEGRGEGSMALSYAAALNEHFLRRITQTVSSSSDEISPAAIRARLRAFQLWRHRWIESTGSD
jgi:hypothetical protein